MDLKKYIKRKKKLSVIRSQKLILMKDDEDFGIVFISIQPFMFYLICSEVILSIISRMFENYLFIIFQDF